MSAPIKKRRLFTEKFTHRVCPHCDREINIKTYREHRRLYFNETSRSWFVATGNTTKADDHQESSSNSSALSSAEELTENEISDFDDFDLPSMKGDSGSIHNAPAVVPDADVEREYWAESDGEIDADLQSPPPLLTDSPLRQDEKDVNSTVWWIVLFVSLFQTLHCIPEKAIAWLIRFLCVLLKYLGQFSPKIALIAKAFPRSIYLKDQYLNFRSNDICRYVVCCGCHSLYCYSECIQKTGSIESSRRCSHKYFSKPCKTQLLKEVVSISRSIKLYPCKLYCYKKVISSLQKLLLRSGFLDLCESTRKVTNCEQVMSDIYHGKIWKDFLVYGGKNFLVSPYCYGLLLNVDWFQPFEHFTYSVGVMYFVVLNLPRSVRYKRENVILVGVIPGPAEPPLNINSYLAPMVSELLQLWKGVNLQVSTTKSQLVKAALLGVSCDLPAGRKVCGFLSHSANLGCSRCYCEFSQGFGRRSDYSNFERNQWQLRSDRKHRDDIKSLRKCKNKTELESKESQFGCRYSELLELPYFNPVRMLLIDPMHCLFLGSAKYVTQKIWIGTGILNKNKLNTIHRRLEALQIPVHIGRLPSKIDSGVTFTAEQWMNWTIYFSIFCLHGLLSSQELECWRHFVLACRRLCNTQLNQLDITIADGLLLLFGKRIKDLYGKEFITPNMHMQCHLSSCIKDYGPLHGFWLFAFERYNGLLGNQPHNNRAIEIQLMNRFVKDNSQLELLHQADSMDLVDVFGPVVSDVARTFGTVTATATNTGIDVTYVEPSKYVLAVLTQECIDVLKQVYCKLYPEYKEMILTNKISLNTTVKQFSSIDMNKKKLSSVKEGLQAKVPYVLAKPLFAFGATPSTSRDELRPAQIQYFIKHSLYLPSNSSPTSHIFAVVHWPLEHPQRHVMGKPVEVWCNTVYEPTMINHFLFLENIKCRVITACDIVNDEEVLVVIPLI